MGPDLLVHQDLPHRYFKRQVYKITYLKEKNEINISAFSVFTHKI